MWQDGLETAAEVAEVVPLLMHLDSLPIILDLREHAVWTLLHGVLDGLAGLSLGGGERGRTSLETYRCSSQRGGWAGIARSPAPLSQSTPSGQEGVKRLSSVIFRYIVFTL